MELSNLLFILDQLWSLRALVDIALLGMGLFFLDGITERLQLFCKIIAPPSVQPVDKRWPDVEVTIDVAPGAAEGHSGGDPP